MNYARVATMLLMSVGLMACSPQNTQNTNNASQASNATQVIRIATEGAYPPFNFTNADGSLGGFDVALAQALCKEMQVQCEIKAQDWDGIIPALKAQKYDAIVAAMSITPERQQAVDFTEPYFSSSLVFLAKKEKDFDPSRANDIEQQRVAAQRTTLSSQWLEQHHPKAQAKLYDTLDNAFLELAAGRADVMIADKMPALTWLASPAGQGFTIKGQDIATDDHFAIAVNKGSVLREQFNTALAKLKSNGEYQKIADQYFQVPTANTASVPASATTATNSP